MAKYGFRAHLASLESEYCRLEAENMRLQDLLATNAEDSSLFLPIQISTAANNGTHVLDVEDVAPFVTLQSEGIHQMSPDDRTSTDTDEAMSVTHQLSSSNDKNKNRRQLPVSSSSGESVDARTTLGGTLAGSAAKGFVEYMSSKRVSMQIFPDAEGMRERVREQVMRKPYDVTDQYHDTGYAQAIAKHGIFESVTMMVISLNAIWIAIDADHNDADLLTDAEVGFQVAEHVFCTFFVCEICVRFGSFVDKRHCLQDMWFVFDLFLVIMMVLETWVLAIVVGVTGRVDVGNVSVLRTVRIIRITRAARLARLLRAMPELMILIKGMLAAARSVFFTLLLLLCFLYVFAIAFTQLLKQTPSGKMYFSTVAHSMNTLWLYATLLEEITTLSHALEAEGLAMVALLDLFILIASLTVMNMLIGVLCEVVSAVAAGEKEQATMSILKSKIQHIFDDLGIDQDHNGMISKSEFEMMIENRYAATAISELGVDVVQLVDMADFIFQSDDGKCDDKALTFNQFMDVVSHFRGVNNSTVKDILQLRKFIRMEFQNERALLQGRASLPSSSASSSFPVGRLRAVSMNSPPSPSSRPDSSSHCNQRMPGIPSLGTKLAAAGREPFETSPRAPSATVSAWQ